MPCSSDAGEIDPTVLLKELGTEAMALERAGLMESAMRLRTLAGRLQVELGPTRFVTEAEAVVLTGRGARWLATRHRGWRRGGGAREIAGIREYRVCVLPIQPGLAPGSA